MQRGGVGRVAAAAAGVVALLAAVPAGCSNADQAETGPEPSAVDARPRTGGRLVYAIEGDPNGLDPTKNVWDPNGIMLANALYDPLVAVSADGQFRPYLAESVTADSTYTAWTVRLRDGVSFSNGDPLDAEALAGFLRELRASIITGPPVQVMSDVAVVDRLTVRITMARPWATFPTLLAGQGGYVVSPKQIADDRGSERPIGTGPFLLRRWQQDRSFELVRNPRYWRAGLPYLDAVHFTVVPEGFQRVNQVLGATIDATNVSNEWDIRRLDDFLADPAMADRLAVQRDGSDSEKSFVMFNTTHAPLDDVRVRRALGYATDVRALAASGGWPLEHQAMGPLSPGTPFFTPAPYPGFDLSRARALVEEYRGDPAVRNRPAEIGFTLTANDVDAQLANDLAQQWARAGLRVQVRQADAKDLARLAALGEYDAMPLHYFANVDPDVLWPFLVGDTVTDLVSLNFTRLRDDAITAGMNEGRATLDIERRQRAYTKVQQALAETMPYVWLSRSEWRIVTTTGARDVRNGTLPDGTRAQPLLGGTHRLTETWMAG